MKITQRTLPSLKLPPGKAETIIFDDELPGFGVRLRAGGSRMWVYQYKTGSKHRRLTLGALAALSADDARERAKDVHAKIRMGGDPAGEKAETRSRAAETFEATVSRYLKQLKARLRPRSYAEVERHLLVHAKPLHGLAVARIERRSLAERLWILAETSGPVAANRTRASLSAFFAWCIREGLTDANPAIATNKSAERSRDRVLTDGELREVWAALGDGQYGDIVRMLILTAQRREEIGSLRRSEVDLDKGSMTLPPERTKNSRTHETPLSGPARAILGRQIQRDDRDLIFGEGQGGFAGWGHAKTALDARIVANCGKPVAPWRLHDLRRTASTRMGDLGVQPHVIEEVLNHASGHKAGVAGVYNRSTYTAEKAAALALWADHVLAVVEGRKSNIVSLKVPA